MFYGWTGASHCWWCQGLWSTGCPLRAAGYWVTPFRCIPISQPGLWGSDSAAECLHLPSPLVTHSGCVILTRNELFFILNHWDLGAICYCCITCSVLSDIHRLTGGLWFWEKWLRVEGSACYLHALLCPRPSNDWGTAAQRPSITQDVCSQLWSPPPTPSSSPWSSSSVFSNWHLS